MNSFESIAPEANRLSHYNKQSRNSNSSFYKFMNIKI